MAMVNLQKITDIYCDVLKEIGNIGAGNAMTALSQMIGCKVDMRVPMVRLLEFNEVGTCMGGEEQIMACVLFGVTGDVSANMMFMIEKSSAKHLLEKILGYAGDGEEFSEMEASALQEVGNIITGAYLNALASFTGMKIISSPPQMTVDMAGAILSVPAIEFGMMGDYLLLIQTQFFDEIEINGYFILIPELESYVKIIGSLGLSTDGLMEDGEKVDE
ncbi:MAG: chemotaxis protein CheC [Lachnospiraceae bacterium]|nr:chemotaxis protein CheC [Lachnospiraceae bacterium]